MAGNESTTERLLAEEEALRQKYQKINSDGNRIYDGPTLEDHQALISLMRGGKIKVEAPNDETLQFGRTEERPAMNLEEMSLNELQQLQKNITRMIDSYQERAKRDALSKLQETAKSFGYTIEELLDVKPEKRTRAPVQPKYRHSENPELTWSGRGRKPAWFASALASGVSLDELLIQ